MLFSKTSCAAWVLSLNASISPTPRDTINHKACLLAIIDAAYLLISAIVFQVDLVRAKPQASSSETVYQVSADSLVMLPWLLRTR